MIRNILQTQTWLHFDNYTLPEAEILRILSFFRDLSFEQQPRPWQGAREPKNDVSGTNNINIVNHIHGSLSNIDIAEA